MNLRSIIDRVPYSEWAILRYSPKPKFGTISILRKLLNRRVPLGCALVSRSLHPSFLPVAAAVALAAGSMAPPTYAQRADAGDWIETWTASPQPICDAEFFAPINIPPALRNHTVRHIAATSMCANRSLGALAHACGS